MSSRPAQPPGLGSDAPADQETPASGVVSRGRLVRLVRSPVVRLALLALLLGLSLALAVSTDDLSPAGLRSTIEGLGLLGPLVYVGLYALITLVLLPATPFTILAGVLFGPVVGSLTAFAGAMLGATGTFLYGRLIGRGPVEQLAGERVQALDRFLADRGFVAMLVVRLVPLFPFNVLNLVSGVTALRRRDYVLGTAVGIVPGTVLLAAVGGTIDDPTSPAFLGAIAGFVGLALGGGILARRFRRGGDPATS